jgi:hypothetical protein
MDGIDREVREMRETAAERELMGGRAAEQRAADGAFAVLARLERVLTAAVRWPGPTAEPQVESPGLGALSVAVREERHMVSVPPPQTTLTHRALR